MEQFLQRPPPCVSWCFIPSHPCIYVSGVSRRFSVDVIMKSQLLLRRIPVPCWVPRERVWSGGVFRAWSVLRESNSESAPFDAPSRPPLLIHGTTMRGLRHALTAPAADVRPGWVFAARTEREEDVLVAATYATAVEVTEAQSCEAALCEHFGSVEVPDDAPLDDSKGSVRRLFPFMAFEADLSGGKLSAAGPMRTFDGELFFDDVDAPPNGPAPVVLFAHDAGMAYAVPFSRIRNLRGIILETSQS
jgi:hypothetical protein